MPAYGGAGSRELEVRRRDRVSLLPEVNPYGYNFTEREAELTSGVHNIGD